MKGRDSSLFRAVWSLLDGIWGLLKGSWGVLGSNILRPCISSCNAIERELLQSSSDLQAVDSCGIALNR